MPSVRSSAAITVLHTVGESDLGIDTRQAPGSSEQQRLARIETVLQDVGGDVAWFNRLPQSGGPLARAVDSLRSRGPLSLLLVCGPAVPGSPSIPSKIADKLRALNWNTIDVEVDVLQLKSFSLGDYVADVATALAMNDGPVVVTWGAGSTDLAFGLLTAAIESRLEWSVLNVERGVASSLDLAPDPAVPALCSWLIRYGHPRDALKVSNLDRDSELGRDLAMAAQRLEDLARGTQAASRAAALAEWVRIDLRRADALSGTSLRSWIEAEYHQRHTTRDGVDLINHVQGSLGTPGKPPATLGRILAEIKSSGDPSVVGARNTSSGKWLCCKKVKAANEAAIQPAHDLMPLAGSQARAAATLLGPVYEFESGVLGPHHLQTGRVAALWVEGRRQDAEGGLELVTRRAAGAELSTWLGTAPPYELSALVVVPPDLRANSIHVDRELGLWQVTACDSCEVESTEFGDAYHAALGWLSQREVDAVVVVPLGAKGPARGVLAAALEYSNRRAVPVFLQSLDRNATTTRYHRLIPNLGLAATLSRVAAQEADRLALDVSAKLLSIGNSEQQRLSAQARDLANRLFGRGADNPGSRMRAVADTCHDVHGSLTERDRVRYILLAEQVTYGQQETPVKALVRVRARLTVTHGESSTKDAIMSLQSPKEQDRYRNWARKGRVESVTKLLNAVANSLSVGSTNALSQDIERFRKELTALS